jgi:hypothetical protein
LAAGCGGGGAEPLDTQHVRGPGSTFSAPTGWEVSRKSHVVSVARPDDDIELVSVSSYRLPRVPTSSQIEAAARQLAATLRGRVTAKTRVFVAGRRAPRFDLTYARAGDEIGLRLIFVLRGRQEFQLLCRWRAPPEAEISAACAQLVRSFRPA